ncbi:MAG: hypothetical protein GY793_09290, partial [Proteobacteria bacterium]|nr:hypothetical protein [Pseudomonadota bacterium]
MQKHWVKDYIGKPYIKGKQDCWTVFCDIQNKIFNKNIELIDFGQIGVFSTRKEFLKHPLRQRFQKLIVPIDGCAVFLSKGQYTSHIGVYLNSGEGKVLHAIEHSGTIIQTISELEVHGWKKIEFYEI